MSVEQIPWTYPVGTRQSVYDAEEKTALELASKTAYKVNELVTEMNDKVGMSELDKRGLDKDGNFTGTWFGFSHPVQSEPGIQAVVNQHVTDIANLKTATNVLPTMNTEIATLKNKVDSSNRDGITITQGRVNAYNTNFTATYVKYDSTNPLKVGVAKTYDPDKNNDYVSGFFTERDYATPSTVGFYTSGNETVRNFSLRKNASYTVNGGVWGIDASNNMVFSGACIVNGNIVCDGATRPDRYILIVGDDGTLSTVQSSTTTANTLKTQGVKNCFNTFPPMITNGLVDNTALNNYVCWTDGSINPVNVVCQMANKDYIFIQFEARNWDSDGMTLPQIVSFIQSTYNPKTCVMLDGGGSMSAVYRGYHLNNVSDSGYVERPVFSFLYFANLERSTKDKDLREIQFLIGETERRLRKLEYNQQWNDSMNKGYMKLQGASDYTTQGIEIWQGAQKNGKLSLFPTQAFLYDYLQGRTQFKVDYNTGDISSSKGIIGMFTDKTVVATSLNTLKESGIYWVTGSTTGTPNTASSWCVLHLSMDKDKTHIQLAIPFQTSNATYKLMFRRTNTADGSWNAWSNLAN